MDITFLLVALGVLYVLYVVVDLIAFKRLRKEFQVAVANMKLDNGEQANRVSGLVRQYRELTKDYKAKVKVMDKLTADLIDLKEYVEDELGEKIEEALLSVDALLDNDDDYEYEERPTQVVPVVAKPQNGLAAVEAAATKKIAGNQYSRYQELRDQGYTAAEATAMLRGQSKGGKRGK